MASVQIANLTTATAALGPAANTVAPAPAANAAVLAPAANAAAPAIPAGPSPQQAKFLKALQAAAIASERYAVSNRAKNFPELEMISYILRWLPNQEGVAEVPTTIQEINNELMKAIRDKNLTIQEIVVEGGDEPAPAQYSKGFYHSEIAQKKVPAGQCAPTTDGPLYEITCTVDGQQMPIIDGAFSITFEPYNPKEHPLEVIVQDAAARERFAEAAAKAIYAERTVQTDASVAAPAAVALVVAAPAPAASPAVAPAAPVSTVSSLSALSELSESDVTPRATTAAKGKGKAEGPAFTPAPAPERTTRRSSRLTTKPATTKPAVEPKPKKAAEPKSKKATEPKVKKAAEPKPKKVAAAKPKVVVAPKAAKEAAPRATKAAPRTTMTATKAKAKATAQEAPAAAESSKAAAEAPKTRRGTKRAHDDKDDGVAAKEVRPAKTRKARAAAEGARRSTRLNPTEEEE